MIKRICFFALLASLFCVCSCLNSGRKILNTNSIITKGKKSIISTFRDRGLEVEHLENFSFNNTSSMFVLDSQTRCLSDYEEPIKEAKFIALEEDVASIFKNSLQRNTSIVLVSPNIKSKDSAAKKDNAWLSGIIKSSRRILKVGDSCPDYGKRIVQSSSGQEKVDSIAYLSILTDCKKTLKDLSSNNYILHVNLCDMGTNMISWQSRSDINNSSLSDNLFNIKRDSLRLKSESLKQRFVNSVNEVTKAIEEQKSR